MHLRVAIRVIRLRGKRRSVRFVLLNLVRKSLVSCLRRGATAIICSGIRQHEFEKGSNQLLFKTKTEESANFDSRWLGGLENLPHFLLRAILDLIVLE